MIAGLVSGATNFVAAGTEMAIMPAILRMQGGFQGVGWHATHPVNVSGHRTRW